MQSVKPRLMGGNGCKADAENKGVPRSQSTCFDCSFPEECVLSDTRQVDSSVSRKAVKFRNEKIVADLSKGMTVREAVKKYNLTDRTIERIRAKG